MSVGWDFSLGLESLPTDRKVSEWCGRGGVDGVVWTVCNKCYMIVFIMICCECVLVGVNVLVV